MGRVRGAVRRWGEGNTQTAWGGGGGRRGGVAGCGGEGRPGWGAGSERVHPSFPASLSPSPAAVGEPLTVRGAAMRGTAAAGGGR